MKKEQKEKVFKGVFISNERKKKAGGRIKCPDFPNKIEVNRFNAALHESDVQWVQIRRFKRNKKDPKPQQSKGKNREEQKSEISPNKVEKKTMKFVEKKMEANDKSEQNQEKSKELLDVDTDQTEPVEDLKENKKAKYGVKEKSKGQKNVKTEEKRIYNITKQTESAKQQKAEKQADTPSSERPQDQERQKQDKEESESSEQEENIRDLQVIVAKVRKETKILYKTKPFVAIMQFIKKRQNKKYKEKKNKEIIGPIDQILEDFNVDVLPIHPRLPVMEIDNLIPQNAQILTKYVTEVLGFSKERKKKELNDILDSLENTYIFVTFSDWDGDFPLVKIHKVLGKALTIDGQCERFLYEHGLNDFNYEEKEQSPKTAIALEPTALHKKLDRMIFTIDPPTSTDLDDALSIQKVGQNFEIGIHIADVSSYLHLIDRDQIIRRTTSVYLPYKVYHMLERHLVKACSLDQGEDRLSFTIWVTMDLEGNVIGDGRLEKNIVRSRYKLSYEVVQNIITGKMDYQQFNLKYPSSKEQFVGIQERLLNLTQIAGAHRKKRIIFDVFENKEMQFKTDESRWPIDCFIDKRYTAKKVVEQFMIIGNIEAARFLVKRQADKALVIHHPKPSKLAVSSFHQQFKMLENKIRFDNVMDVQKQLLEIDKQQKLKEQIKLLCYFKARRVMEPAVYRKYSEVMEEWKEKKAQKKEGDKEEKSESIDVKAQNEKYPEVHYALGLQFYTHFTSPMRRMADILVHEALTSLLEEKEPQPLLDDQIEKINLGRRNTKRLKKDLNEVYLCLMVHHTKENIQTEGILSSFGMESVSIYIPLFDMQKQVLWKKELAIHSIKRIRDKDDRMDVKLYHDPKTAKKDIYWVMKKFEKVKLSLGCTKGAPLRLTVEMTVESEKGPFKIEWNES